MVRGGPATRRGARLAQGRHPLETGHVRRRHLVLLPIAFLLLGAGWWLLRNAGEQADGGAVARDESRGAASHPASGGAKEDAPSLSGSSDAQPPPAPSGTRGEVRVRALGRDGQPLPDLPVIVSDADGSVLAAAFTNARGEQAFAGVPFDGTARIAACHLDERGRLVPADFRLVTSPEVILRTDLGLPCEVVIVDAESGAALSEVGWSLYPWDTFLSAVGLGLRPGPRPLPLRPGVGLKVTLRLGVPAGYVAWSDLEPRVEITRFTTALRYVYPLHREADVVIDVLEHDGSPAREPWVTSWTLAGTEGAPLFGGGSTEPLALNRMRLRGVPYVAGALLRVRVGLRDDAEDPRIVGVEAQLERPTRLVARLPHPEAYELPDDLFEEPGPSTIGIGGSRAERPPRPPPGLLDLQGTLRAGGPATGAILSLQYLELEYALGGLRATLDDAGRLQQDLPEGTWEVAFYEPGLVHSMQTFEIRRGETTRVRFQEGQGGTIRLRVVDAAGRPLPFARFRIHDWTWCDLENGVQRLDPFVDENGSRTLRHLSSDQPLKVTAWYAGGHATVRCPVREGETIDVTVEVEPAK